MSRSGPSTQLQPSLGYLLRRAQHAFRTRIDDSLRPLGLTAPQYAAMAAVEADEGISNAELARAAFVTAQSMQGILANLERKRLLTRNAHPGHGRIRCSELTARGRAILAQARLRVQKIEQLLAEAVGPDLRAQFEALLSRCANTLDGAALSSARSR